MQVTSRFGVCGPESWYVPLSTIYYPSRPANVLSVRVASITFVDVCGLLAGPTGEPWPLPTLTSREVVAFTLIKPMQLTDWNNKLTLDTLLTCSEIPYHESIMDVTMWLSERYNWHSAKAARETCTKVGCGLWQWHFMKHRVHAFVPTTLHVLLVQFRNSLQPRLAWLQTFYMRLSDCPEVLQSWSQIQPIRNRKHPREVFQHWHNVDSWLVNPLPPPLNNQGLQNDITRKPINW